MPSHAKNNPFDWQKDAQQSLQKMGNPSAIIPNALSALMNLKKVQNNPTAIQSIGASNYAAIQQQSGSWFSSQGKSNTAPANNIIYDCNTLISMSNNLLSNDELAQKAVCLLLEVELALEANGGANTANVVSTPNTEFANPQSGLSLTLAAMTNNINQMANNVNPIITGTFTLSDVTIVGGADAISYNVGTISTGTFIPDPHLGDFQHYINGGAHILSPPANVCSIVLECTNQGAGAIAFTGFSVVTGDVYSSAGTKSHIFYITKTQNFAHLGVTYVTGT